MKISKIYLEYQNFVLNLIGLLILIWGLAAIVNTIIIGFPEGIFWFCYVGMVLIGLGVLFRRGWLIASQILVLGIPLIAWNIDAFSYLITGNFVWGFTSYFFGSARGLVSEIISAQHFFTIPLGLFVLWLIKFKGKWFIFISFLEVCLLFVFTRFLAGPTGNVNCVFKNCLGFGFNLPYVFEWFLAYFVIIIINYFILLKLKIFEKGKSY